MKTAIAVITVVVLAIAVAAASTQLLAQRQQMAPRPKEELKLLDPPSPVQEYQWIVKERYCYLLLGGEQIGAYDRRYNCYRPLSRVSETCYWWEKPCEPPVDFLQE